jgi:F-type H+-transporting ATPase subunit b
LSRLKPPARVAAILALGAAVAGAAAAFAQHGEESTGAVAGAAAESSPGIMSVNPGLMVWTAVTFVLLLVVLRFLAWKPLLAGLEAREQRIRDALQQAERNRQESAELLARHRAELDGARAEVEKILEAGKAEALRIQQEITEAARAEAESTQQRARREVELAAEQASRQLWEEATRLSTQLAERILGRSLNEGDHRRLVEEVLDEFRSVRPAGSD